ncbi:hypothetical protein Q3O60_05305 [Alkalimonas collagenimarina]|uniref:Uncharacterized protein n=1 Tax=Alkalimonas collagenimarina TaxID=400390 RepID=A0ABT9GX09_9GAMM|nr:hypothetical protein [Alkalimonas collagenimarina]MDP4535595.1 hypothetical protein [Alkalimonas collagenimarina]
MQERLREALESINLTFGEPGSESVSAEICRWYEQADRNEPKQFLTENYLVIAKSKSAEILSLSITERMPGPLLAVVKPDPEFFKVEFPVDSSD